MTPHGSTIVREVISSTSSGADVMSALPGLVGQLLDEEAWREFSVPGIAKPVRHSTFTEFVCADPPRGLGNRSSQLVALCGTDEDLASRVRRLLYAEIPVAMQHGDGPGRGHTEKRDGTATSFSANTAEKVVARLKRDDPGLAERVVRGDVTPNAAAREKGWRKPRIVLSTPERVAASLRKWMPADSLMRLARLLLDEAAEPPPEPSDD